MQKVYERYQSSEENSRSDSERYSSGGITDGTDCSSDYYASDFEVETALAGENDPSRRRLLKRSKKLFRMPGLLMTVALCYLGGLILRIPVSLGDLHRWIDTQELPYTVAVKEIPQDMIEKLPGAYVKALKPIVWRQNP